ncbi:hypothetical protein BDF19DRAFT_137986 [Syncephalis fuscata]|nr:hypothetical protein BDF19DRAFT_137986 [Syncephalis fuscata]
MDLPDIFDSSSDDDDLREMLAAQLGKTVDQLPSCRRDGTARRAQPSSPPASFNVNGRHAESSSNPRPTSGYGSTTIWVDGMPVRQTDPRQIQATRPRNGFNSTQANSNNNASYDYQSRLYDEPAEYNRERHNSHNDTQYDERLDRLNGENRAPIYNNNIYNAQQDISFVRRDQPRSPIIRSNQYGSSSQDEDDNQQSNNEATIRNNVRSPPAPNNQTRRIARVSTVFRQMHQERQINDSDEHGKQIDNQPPEISFDMIDRYRQQLNQEEERRFSRRSEHNTDRRNGRNSYSSRPEQSAYSPPSTRTTVRMPRCLLISLRGVPEQANLQDIVKVFSEFGNLYSARLDLKTNTGGHTSASRHTGRGAICYMPISPNPHTIIRKLIERTEALSISICNSSD